MLNDILLQLMMGDPAFNLSVRLKKCLNAAYITVRPDNCVNIFIINGMAYPYCRGIVTADVLKLGLSRGAIAARKLEGVNGTRNTRV